MTTPHWTNGVATLYHADARAIPLPNGSVHCCITSPPYWGLRDYGLAIWGGGDPGCEHVKPRPEYLPDYDIQVPHAWGHWQEAWPGGICGHCGATQQAAGIGLEPTLSDWLANIVAVSREVWRMLRDDGTYWLNLGDAYDAGTSAKRKASKNVDVGYWQQAESIGGSRVNAGLGAKQLMGQPWRAAFALQDDGWVLRSAIVWHKPNPMPESTRDRPTSAYEMVFLFAKCEETPQFWTHRDGPGTRTAPAPDYRWQDVVTGLEYSQEPSNYSEDMIECPDCAGAGEIMLQAGQVSMFDGVPQMVHDCDKCDGEGEVKRWKRVNLWTGHDYFYDADAIREPQTQGTFDRFGNGGAPMKPSIKEGGSARKKASFMANTLDPILPNGRNARNVWVIPTQGRPEAHFATFPDELPRRCILAGTSAHGVCADCGAPWARQTETANTSDVQWDANDKQSGHGPTHAGFNARWKESGGVRTKAIGWQPTCDHNADRIPATVLDPFVGSGTTLAVAQQLGRAGIGLDLNPEYLGIACKRLMKS